MREQTPTRTLSRLRRCLRKIVRVLLLAVASIILLYTLSGVVFGILIWAENRRIKREGDPVTLADIIPQMPPDSENGAIIYEKVFRMIDSPYASSNKLKKFEALSYLRSKANRDKNPKLWELANAELSQFLPIVKMVREAASKPHCVYREDWKRGVFPTPAKVRKLVHLLCSYALLRAHNGDTDEAMTALKLAIRVGHTEDNDTLLYFMIRENTYCSVGQAALEIVLERHVDERAVQALVDALAWDSLGRDVPLVMKCERAYYNSEYLDSIRSNAALVAEVYGDEDAVSPYRRLELSWIGKPVFLADRLCFLRAMRRTIKDIGIPFRNLPVVKPTWRNCGCEPDGWMYKDELYIIYRDMNKWFDKDAAHVSGIRLAIAACIYKHRFGAYPQKLSDLSKLGWHVDTEDPFTGRDFIYKPSNNGYILYSVGEDLIDNGGKITPYKSPLYGDDIVWKVPLPRLERPAYAMPGKNALSPPSMGPGTAGIPGMPGAPPNPSSLPGQSVK